MPSRERGRPHGGPMPVPSWTWPPCAADAARHWTCHLGACGLRPLPGRGRPGRLRLREKPRRAVPSGAPCLSRGEGRGRWRRRACARTSAGCTSSGSNLQISEPSASVSHREVSTRCLGLSFTLLLFPPLPCFPGDRERARPARSRERRRRERDRFGRAACSGWSCRNPAACSACHGMSLSMAVTASSKDWPLRMASAMRHDAANHTYLTSWRP